MFPVYSIILLSIWRRRNYVNANHVVQIDRELELVSDNKLIGTILS